MTDSLGDRMKEYEARYAGARALPLLPLCVRLDGKAFHGWCRGLKRPYDDGFMLLMDYVAAALVRQSNARIGYVQSDEITLILLAERSEEQVFFDGKLTKIVSVLASMATAEFNAAVPQFLPAKVGTLALFDCRVWQVPNLDEAANVLVWRELDCTRNSLTMAAQTKYGHADLHEKNGADKHEMLHAVGINWSDYPARFKRGRYFARRARERAFTADEIARIPERHRPEPGAVILRHDVVPLDLPPILSIGNRVEALFYGADLVPAEATRNQTAYRAAKGR